MSLARPAIATDVGGAAEIIGSGDAAGGILLGDAQPVTIASALLELRANPDRREKLAASARARQVRLYGEDAMIDKYAALLHALASRRAPPMGRHLSGHLPPSHTGPDKA